MQVTRCRSQIEGRSVADLIASLSHPYDISERLRFGPECDGLTDTLAKQRTARSIVECGEAAIPELSKALDSIEQRGSESEFLLNIGWLLDPYATIAGPAAYPRLKRMAGVPALRSWERALDNAMALSLHLTSYDNALDMPALPFCSFQGRGMRLTKRSWRG